MNNYDFQKLLDEEKWDEATREAFAFWEGGPNRQRRLIIALIRKLMEAKAP